MRLGCLFFLRQFELKLKKTNLAENKKMKEDGIDKQ
jgi:hypothetical protein